MFWIANQSLADLSLPQHLTCVLEPLQPFEAFHSFEKARSWGSFPGSQCRYFVLSGKSRLSSPLWGAVSQNVYIGIVPLVANVLTFTPSNRVLVFIKTETAQRRVWIELCLFQHLRVAKYKNRPTVIWCGNIWISVRREPLQREAANWFFACLGRMWKRWVDKVCLPLICALAEDRRWTECPASEVGVGGKGVELEQMSVSEGMRNRD